MKHLELDLGKENLKKLDKKVVWLVQFEFLDASWSWRSQLSWFKQSHWEQSEEIAQGKFCSRMDCGMCWLLLPIQCGA